jgi:hypothetical protein
VNNQPYLEYVSQFAGQDEVRSLCVFALLLVILIPYCQISHCVGFAALWSANTKKHKGLRATGVGAVSCARHQLFRPNGMGDLQVGER